MRICVDVDGTIDKVKHLYPLLKATNAEIYFLTTKRKTKHERIQQLKELGINEYKDIVIVEGASHQWVAYHKALFCKENNINIVFENNSLNISYIKSENPLIDCWLLY